MTRHSKLKLAALNWESPRYKRYVLGILLGLLAFNLIDRLALGLLLQDIKSELRLSDTQLGFLSGIAFALFYAVMGIPIARWADRGNRATIISLTAMLWGVTVALCGVAASLTQLLLIRVAVGVGEAGCIPPAHSLIADYFSRAERPRVVSIYALGVPVSVILGYFLTGWLDSKYGWRMTFILLGTPGLLLAVVTWSTLKDPLRERSSATVPTAPPWADRIGSPQIATLKVCSILWRNRTFRQLLFGFSVIYFFSYGILLWQPTFLLRTYGFEPFQLGMIMSVVVGFGGLLGTILGGELASRYAARNERLQLAGISITYIGVGVFSAGSYLATNRWLALSLIGVSSFLGSAVFGPLLATIQTLVAAHMRATSIAILNLFANLIGMGLGPLAAGGLSDSLRPFLGDNSLRTALLVLSPGYLWAAWHVWRASQTVAGDLNADSNPKRRGESDHQVASAI